MPRIEDEDGDEGHPLLGQMRPVSYVLVIGVCQCADIDACT
jgi:hypothetical protein